MKEIPQEISHYVRRVEQGEELSERECYELTIAFKSNPLPELQSAVERLIQHPIELVRQSAMDALIYGDWTKREYLTLASKLLEKDKDSGTRGLAATALATLSKKFGTRDALPLLVRVVKNQQEHHEVRLDAYASILLILGAPSPKIPRMGDETWDPDRDIDWELIHSIETSLK